MASPPQTSDDTPDVSHALREVRTVATLEEAAALEELTARLFRARTRRPELARYRILHPVGVGGLGVVFAAEDPALDRRVAVKLVRRRAQDDRSLERLTREAQLLARLSAPNLVQIYDIGWYGPGDLGSTPPQDVPSTGLFIVMELVDGSDAQKWLATQPPASEILRVFAEAGEGLAVAHEAGVVHRDFKPANVIVPRTGPTKVLDFGLAFEDGSSTHSTPGVGSGPLTQTGSIAGTPLYMAPEQHEGALADTRSDQYSFCLSLAQALLGHRLVSGGSNEAILASKRALRIGTARTIPRPVRRVLARGLSVDPGARYPNMRALLAELRPARGRRTALVVWCGVAFAAVTGAWILGPAPATASVDCEAEVGALVDRIAASRGLEGTTAPDLVVRAVRDREADERSRLRDDLLAACRAGEAPSASSISPGCVAARDAHRDALLATLSESGEARGAGTAAALRAVAKADTCLRTEPESPHDAEIMGHLGRARALQLLDRWEGSQAEFVAAVELAREHDLPRLEARGQLGLGGLLEFWKPREGVTPLEQAYFLGEKTGDAEVATRAAVRLAWAAASYEGHAAAERWIRHAKTHLDRARDERLPTEELEGQIAWGSLAIADYEGAIAHAERALQLHAEGDPHDDMETAQYLGVIVHAAGRLGDFERAEAVSRREVAVLVSALGEDHPDVADSRGTLAAVLIETGRHAEALEHCHATLDVMRRWTAPDDPRLGLATARLGDALAGVGRHEEAIANYEAAKKIWPDTPLSSPWIAEADLALARAHAALGDDTRARDLALAAARRAEQLGRPGDRMPIEAREVADAADRRLRERDD